MNDLELRKLLWARTAPLPHTIHPSQVDQFRPGGLSQGLWTRAWRSPRAAQHLSRYIGSQLQIPTDEDLRMVSWPLVLLADDRLRRLQLHLAAAVAASVVRQALSGEQVRLWRQWLGTEAHAFALQSASLLPALPAAADGSHSLIEMTASQAGQQVIRMASSAWPESVRQRMHLRLEQSAAAVPSDQTAHLGPALASRLISRVLLILEPSWCSSFER